MVCAQICDFGLARVLDETPGRASPPLTQEVVTQYYRAPELLMGARRYSYSVDVWSIGCIFAELLSRKILFQAHSPLAQLDLIVELLGTPNLSTELRHTADQARQYVMRAGPRSPQFERLYKLSALCTHEALTLLKRMLAFDPVCLCVLVSFSYSLLRTRTRTIVLLRMRICECESIRIRIRTHSKSSLSALAPVALVLARRLLAPQLAQRSFSSSSHTHSHTQTQTHSLRQTLSTRCVAASSESSVRIRMRSRPCRQCLSLSLAYGFVAPRTTDAMR